MPAYTYLAHDLRSGQPVAELPLQAVTYTTTLNDDGTLAGSIPAGAARGRADLLNVLPARTVIYVNRDGALIGPGWILWDPDPQPGKVDIPSSGCRGMLSYFDHRRIRSTLTYAQTDQFAIAEDIVTEMQSQDGGDVGVVVLGLLSGVLRDRTYLGNELKNVREAIQELSAVINGFDFRFEAHYGPTGNPEVHFNLGYPYLGLDVVNSGLVLEYPGNLTSYKFTKVGSQITTRVDALGSGDGDDALRATAVNQNLIDAGWPILEQDVSFTDVSVQSTLDDHALAEALARRGVVVTPQVTLKGDEPPVDSYEVGDWARLRITDDVFSGSGLAADVDVQARIVEKAVVVPDDSDVEDVTLTLSAVILP